MPVVITPLTRLQITILAEITPRCTWSFLAGKLIRHASAAALATLPTIHTTAGPVVQRQLLDASQVKES